VNNDISSDIQGSMIFRDMLFLNNIPFIPHVCLSNHTYGYTISSILITLTRIILNHSMNGLQNWSYIQSQYTTHLLWKG